MKTLTYYLLLVTLASCSSPAGEGSSNVAIVTTHAAATSGKILPNSVPTKFIFDVPALLGKDIDQLTHLLGKPKEPDAPNLTVDELERRYNREGYRLVINYNTKTRQVAGFFLAAPDPSGVTKDCNKLLQAGNLNPRSSSYSLDTLESDKRGYFTGLVITNNE